jgi:hypothetical protein
MPFIKEQKLALMQLQRRLIELIREIELEGEPSPVPIIVLTDDFEFQLEYSKKMKRFLVLIKPKD